MRCCVVLCLGRGGRAFGEEGVALDEGVQKMGDGMVGQQTFGGLVYGGGASRSDESGVVCAHRVCQSTFWY